MNADDLVVRLQATLDETERVAGDLAADGWPKHDGKVLSVEGTGLEVPWPDRWNPVRVLDMCKAHRDLIAEWQKQATIRDILADDPDVSDDAHVTAVGITAGLWAAVTIVARGYGIEDQTGTETEER